MTAANWQTLDARIRERADDRAWHREIIHRAGSSESAPRSRGGNRPRTTTCCSTRWNGPSSRVASGANSTRRSMSWRRAGAGCPRAPADRRRHRPATERVIARSTTCTPPIDSYVGHIPYDRILSTATHLSAPTSTSIRRPSDEDGPGARAPGHAGSVERDIYAAYINEAFLTALRAAHGRSNGLPVQLRRRASALRDRQPAVAADDQQLGRDDQPASAAALPVLPGQRHANQSMCTLCRELPNFALVGFWWHNFFPAIIRQRDRRADRHAASRTGRSASFPTPTAWTGCTRRRRW